MNKNLTAILLLNLGGPDSIQAVRPFLYNLFSDRQIIRLGPSFLQKPIAGFISFFRSKKTEKYYKLIGGKSPILEITQAQAKALEKALDKSEDNNEFKVFIGMRYWHPFIENVVSEINQNGIKKIIALSLYPQYSITTSGSSFTRLDEVSKKFDLRITKIESWNNHPLYIDALVDVIRKGLDSFFENVSSYSFSEIHVLFSAHSLPKKIIDAGDPYEKQTLETINEITKKINIQWHLSYQSRSGPVKWLEPSTEEKLKELSEKGVKNVLIVPISFVSDHIETLYEIDIFYKSLAKELGINMKRADSLNTHPLFIEALKDIVLKNTKS
ncbi:MAG: ferrochelatase [Nitrospirae bacterium]|nr:ferrochelatase [Nitrospirota bacterium]